MGMVAIPIPLKDEAGHSNLAVTLFLANGNKENVVLAYGLTSFGDFLASLPHDMEQENESRDKLSAHGTNYHL